MPSTPQTAVVRAVTDDDERVRLSTSRGVGRDGLRRKAQFPCVTVEWARRMTTEASVSLRRSGLGGNGS